MIRHVVVEDTTWPVDVSTEDEDAAEWVLRYGNTERREEQRMSVASILSAYSDLTDPHRSLKDATAMLRRARMSRSDEKPKVMYCVARGVYSDYRVMCVCDSQARAKAVAKAYNAGEDSYSEARVETISFVDYEPEQVTLYHLMVEVFDDGTTSEQTERETTEWPFDSWDPLVRVAWRWVRAPVYHGKGGRLDVHGTDLEAVRHVLSDRRAQLMVDDAFRKRKEAKG